MLTGAGHGFCSGADLVGAGRVPNIDGLQRTSIARRALKVLDNVILTARDMHQPVIAAVNGTAIGAGSACRRRRPASRVGHRVFSGSPASTMV